jgi:amino acid transporter
LTFAALFALTFISTRIAIKAQTAVFLLVCLALVVIFLGGSINVGEMKTPVFGAFEDMSFWGLFALFFPAVTGLMAGIGLSGELSDPKRQIPRGVMYGLGTTAVIYLAMVVLLGYSATSGQLIENSLIIVTLSAFGPVVLLGILAATFSSALTTIVAAPRVLQALSENAILPMSDFLAKKTKEGEPKNAILITGLLVFLLLFIGSLNSIAQALTMFFLITYAMINVSVFIEQSLGLASFRPTFKVPKAVPLYGAISSIAIMFLINALIGLIAILFVLVTYVLLLHKDLKKKKGDIRSGLFREISEWAAKKVVSLPEATKHVWRPNILVPVLTTKTLFGNFPLINAIAHPHGTMTVLGFKLTKNIKDNPEEAKITKKQMEKELRQLPNLVKKFGEKGIFTSFSTVELNDYVNGVIVALGAIESQVFSPNILFLPFKPDKLSKSNLEDVIDIAKNEKVGTVIFDRDQELGLGAEKDVHIWISPKAMKEEFYEDRYFDLAMLIAHGIRRNWNGNLTIWMCVDKKKSSRAKKVKNAASSKEKTVEKDVK